MKMSTIVKPPAAPAAQGTTKTASVATESRVSRTIAQALDAIAGTPTTKTASDDAAKTPVNDLQKLASDVTEEVAERQQRLMSKLGMILADAFVARMGQHEKIAAELEQEKVASLGLEEHEIGMILEYRANPRGFAEKVAAQLAAVSGGEQLTEKQASAIVEAQEEQTLRDVHKLACAHAEEGYNAIMEVLSA